MEERLPELNSQNHMGDGILNFLKQNYFLGILFFLIISSTTLTISFGESSGMTTVPSPKHQIKEGILPDKVTCSTELRLIFKSTDSSPACVKSSTAAKLIGRGWGLESFHLDEHDQIYYQILNQKISPQIDFKPPIWIIEQEDYSIFLVKTYKGNDGVGDSIMDILVDNIATEFSIDEIKDPHSIIGWYGLKGDYRLSNIYDVSFVFKTENKEIVYTWLSDLEKNDVGPRDEVTKNLMLKLDS